MKVEPILGYPPVLEVRFDPCFVESEVISAAVNGVFAINRVLYQRLVLSFLKRGYLVLLLPLFLPLLPFLPFLCVSGLPFETYFTDLEVDVRHSVGDRPLLEREEEGEQEREEREGGGT